MPLVNVPRRPSLVRWDSTSPDRPFEIESKAMRGRMIKVWRTDGYGGPIPKDDLFLITHMVFPMGRIHHIQNHHAFGYTRYDVEVQALAPILEVPDVFVTEH